MTASNLKIPDEDRPKSRFRLFQPILAGANLRDRLIACLGSLIGISVTAAICGLLFRHDPRLPLIVAPVGASAVLLFGCRPARWRSLGRLSAETPYRRSSG